MIILLIILFAVFTVLIFNILIAVLNAPFIKYRERIRKLNNKSNKIRSVGFLSRHIHINETKREIIKMKLNRCNMNMSPEEFYAETLLHSIIVISCIPFFILLGLGIIIIPLIFLAVSLYFSKVKKLDDKINVVNNRIISELPAFIRNFSYSLGVSRDITGIIDRYRDIAGEELKKELDILVMDMKTGSYEEALSKFERKLDIEPVTSFVSGIMGISRGIDYKTYFFVLEENMKILAKETLKREVKTRPGKLHKAILIIIILTGLMYMIPMLIQMKESLGDFL